MRKTFEIFAVAVLLMSMWPARADAAPLLLQLEQPEFAPRQIVDNQPGDDIDPRTGVSIQSWVNPANLIGLVPLSPGVVPAGSAIVFGPPGPTFGRFPFGQPVTDTVDVLVTGPFSIFHRAIINGPPDPIAGGFTVNTRVAPFLSPSRSCCLAAAWWVSLPASDDSHEVVEKVSPRKSALSSQRSGGGRRAEASSGNEVRNHCYARCIRCGHGTATHVKCDELLCGHARNCLGGRSQVMSGRDIALPMLRRTQQEGNREGSTR